MSVTNPERVVTKQDLADFYDELLPFISPKSYAGFTPIGTIIPMIAESAPANYLICDGATYNKSDYPELAAHLLSMSYNTPYIVSGDDTKFKVPGLRGEFIRGTGTNSHLNNGNGANVGVHQDGTQFPVYGLTVNSSKPSLNIYHAYDSSNNPLTDTSAINLDKTITRENTNTIKRTAINGSGLTEGTTSMTYEMTAARPTNTSVLFCIATKNIYLDPKNDYSTEEKVIGTWVDGSTLYQRTIVDTMPVIGTDGTVVAKGIDISSWNLDKCVSVEGMAYISNNFNAIDSCWNLSGAGSPQYFIRTNVGLINDAMSFQIRCNRSALSEANFYATLQYTKTT